jgi:hypothetical protein
MFNNFPFCVGDMEILYIILVENLLFLSAKSNREKLFLERFSFIPVLKTDINGRGDPLR